MCNLVNDNFAQYSSISNGSVSIYAYRENECIYCSIAQLDFLKCEWMGLLVQRDRVLVCNSERQPSTIIHLYQTTQPPPPPPYAHRENNSTAGLPNYTLLDNIRLVFFLRPRLSYKHSGPSSLLLSAYQKALTNPAANSAPRRFHQSCLLNRNIEPFAVRVEAIPGFIVSPPDRPASGTTLLHLSLEMSLI